jgi:hypothetical protein
MCKGGWRGIAIHGLFDCEKSLAILDTTAFEQAGYVLGRYIIFEPRSHVNVYLDGLEQLFDVHDPGFNVKPTGLHGPGCRVHVLLFLDCSSRGQAR